MNHCHIRRHGHRDTDTDVDEDKVKDNDTDTGRPLPLLTPSVVIVRLSSKLALWRWFLVWPHTQISRSRDSLLRTSVQPETRTRR